MRNKKPRVVLRADCGASIGVGHVFRCLSLAEILKDDFYIIFAIQHPFDNVATLVNEMADEVISLNKTNDYTSDALQLVNHLVSSDIVVLDGYQFTGEYQKIIKEAGYKLVYIDDLHLWHQFADVIINHAEGVSATSYSKEPYTKLYLGLDYAILRKPFLEYDIQARRIQSIGKVFISMGAGDINNVSQKFAGALLQINEIEEIHLLVGAVNPNLESIEKFIKDTGSSKINIHKSLSAEEIVLLLRNCDICICPASNTSIESCAVGIGLVSGFTAENQLETLAGLEKKNVLINFGDFVGLSVNDIKTAFDKLVKQPGIFDPLIENQTKLIDRKSPERLRGLFAALSGNSLHFRMAEYSDVDLYYQWTSDDLVRNNSFSTGTIAYDDHVNWFRSKVGSANCFLYLFLNDTGEAVGQVRIDKGSEEAVIGISIAEAFRGKSMGVEMLTGSTDDYLNKYPTDTIIAYIKVENVASNKSFIKAGFDNEEIVTYKDFKCYKLYKKRGI